MAVLHANQCEELKTLVRKNSHKITVQLEGVATYGIKHYKS
jgi:hypothetical protein